MTMPAEVGRERQVGRYALFGEIAAGGMATVHFGRLIGPAGFARTCAIKRLHAQFARDPEFVSMFLDEARLAARIQHPNVVSTLDVVPLEGELFLVMEYVQGESLSRLVRMMKQRNDRIPLRILAAIVVGALHGLHAAHEAKSERGEPLGIVHRDVSPQNVIVGIDGVARVLDFGVAKAAGRIQTTRDGQIKGKLAYMAPEQIRGVGVDRRTDVYAAGVMLWEAITGVRMFDGENEANILAMVLDGHDVPPSARVPNISAELDRVVMCSLERDSTKRFGTAREMAIALERAVGIASPYEVGEWVESIAADTLAKRAQSIKEIESTSAVRAIPTGEQMVGNGPNSLSGQWGDVPSRNDAFAATMQAPGQTNVGPPPSMVPSIPSGASGAAHSYVSPPPPKSNGALVIAAVVATLLAISVVIAVVIQISTAKPPVADAAIDPAPTATAAVTTKATADKLPVINLDVPPSATVVALPPSATATATAKTTATTTTTGTKATTTTVKPPPPPPTTKSGCNPPYTIDANGVRHPRPECLN